MNNKVSIVKCISYDPERLYSSLKTAAEAAELPDINGKTVLLKPNILRDTAPEKAVTTHPGFLEAVINLVREWGASRILVGDSPGFQGPNFNPHLCCLREVAIKNNAEWVDFTKNKIEVDCPKGKVQRKFNVCGALKEADVVINLPKLKTHQLMYFTGAMKNLFGLIPSAAKSPYHVRYSTRDSFASMIVDLNLINKPVYAFMDAVIGMEGHGPGSGDPRQIGLVLASSNSLAMDIAACTIIGYPSEKIPVIREALARRIWLNDISEIEYPLQKPEEHFIRDFKKIPFKKTRSQLVDFFLPKSLLKMRESPVPAINLNLCVGCGDCERICASGAISITGDREAEHAEINQKLCISCYCCHEICPARAIEV